MLIWAARPGSATDAFPDPQLEAAAEARWAGDIAALEALDRTEVHPADSVLFVGSSSIRLWQTIETDLAPYHPIRRGYGGAKFSDLAVFARRLIAPHRFRALVVFAANDVTGGPDDATPEQVVQWFEHWVGVARAIQPDAPVLCLEITPTPARWVAWPKIREVNRALAGACASRSGVHFIPTAHAWLGPDGQPQADLFVEDGLHLNPLGYRIWSAILTSHLDVILDPSLSGRSTAASTSRPFSPDQASSMPIPCGR